MRRETEKVMENFEKAQQVSAIIDRKKKRGEELLQVRRRGERYDTHPFCSPSTPRDGSNSGR